MSINNVESSAVIAEVVTAYPLSNDTRVHLIDKLSTAIGKTVELDEQVDPTLIAGIQISVLGRFFDSSIATQLHELQIQLSATVSGVNADDRSD